MAQENNRFLMLNNIFINVNSIRRVEKGNSYFNIFLCDGKTININNALDPYSYTVIETVFHNPHYTKFVKSV